MLLYKNSIIGIKYKQDCHRYPDTYGSLMLYYNLAQRIQPFVKLQRGSTISESGNNDSIAQTIVGINVSIIKNENRDLSIEAKGFMRDKIDMGPVSVKYSKNIDKNLRVSSKISVHGYDPVFCSRMTYSFENGFKVGVD